MGTRLPVLWTHMGHASHQGSHPITTNEVKFVIIFYSNKGGKKIKNTYSPQRQNMQTVCASLFSFFNEFSGKLLPLHYLIDYGP